MSTDIMERPLYMKKSSIITAEHPTPNHPKTM